MNKIILLISSMLISFTVGYSQPGQPDASFGNNGKVTADLGSPFNYKTNGRQVLVGADQSIYMILNQPTFISKRRPNGSVDSSYGLNGYSTFVPFIYRHAALQTDGKILIAGTGYTISGYAVARINANGMPDSSFGVNGIKVLGFEPASVTLQNDGKILLSGGGNGFLIARYNQDGSTDSSFNKTGITITDFGFKLPRDRDPDDSFEVHTGYATSIALMPNGQIVAGGGASTPTSDDYAAFAVARYNKDGSPDSTFGINGRQTLKLSEGNDFVYSANVQSDGKIVLAGNAEDHFAIVRYTVNGRLDSTFNGNGIQDYNPGSYTQIGNSVVIQNNGKIVLAGSRLKQIIGTFQDYDFALVRFNEDGSLDKSFDKDGKLTTDFSSVEFSSSRDYALSLAIQNDGKVLAAGYSIGVLPGGDRLTRFAASRYNADGSPDSSFNYDGKLNSIFNQGDTKFNSISFQVDGKIIIAGDTWNGSNSDFAVARYNTNGSPDSTFASNGIQQTDFGSDEFEPGVAMQNDGNIVVAGSSNISNPNLAVVRYKSNGTIDSSFASNGKLTTTFGFYTAALYALAIQSNEKIVVGLITSDADYNTGFSIVRLNTNGRVDSTFDTDGIQTILQAPFFGSTLALQPDGKIVLTGFNNDELAVMRFNNNGSLDTTFSTDGVQTTNFGPFDAVGNSIALQKDGKIIVGGGSRGIGGVYGGVSLLARYNVNGGLDTAFGTDGKQITQFGYIRSITIQDDGKIVAASASNISRYNENGSLDITFNDDGVVNTSQQFIADIGIANKKLYTAGYGQFGGNIGVIARYLLDNKIALHPTVSLVTPSDNASYLSGGNVYLQAMASDSDGTISKVEFYSDTNLLHTATESPYTFKWPHVNTGNYTLTAKATDNSGLVTTSPPVHISVVPNKAPSVSIISPANGISFTAPASITLEAAAADPDGRIIKVDFYNGATLLNTITERKPPYSYQWQNVPAGVYNITAVAQDNWGETIASAPVTVTVTSDGIVSSKPSPLNNKTNITGAISLKLAPNPAKNKVNIYTTGLQKDKLTALSVISASGVIIKTVKLSGSNQTIPLDVSSLASGVYSIKIINGEKVMYKKLVKM